MRTNREISEAFHVTCSGISKMMSNGRGKDTMGKTAETYCLDWLKSQPEFFNRRPNYSNKYTEKGILVEDESLDFVAEHLGYGLILKNEHRFKSACGRITGIPDNVQPNHTIDVKNSWSWETFPIFETELDTAYEWQGQGQMFITGVESHKTIYILTDTPAHLIEREASHQANKWGYDYEEILEQLLEEMTYSDLDPAKRVKVYEIKADKERQQAILDRVDLCRKFIFDVLESLKN
jgi:hypothetical protein